MQFIVGIKEKVEEEKSSIRNYNAYVSSSNNGQLVKTILKARNWWAIKDKSKLKELDFIWTPWVKSKPQTECNN
jgi:hypothetical protein